MFLFSLRFYNFAGLREIAGLTQLHLVKVAETFSTGISLKKK